MPNPNILGVYRRSNDINVFIDIKSIPELHSVRADESSLTFGGNVSLTEFMETLEGASKKCKDYTYATSMAKHLDLVATIPVRNVNIFYFTNFRISRLISDFVDRPGPLLVI